MSISNPIEKLIHDLEQERAKKYWERIKRFKAQEEEQKKSGEVHEKKQLEYMRSAGINLKQVEKEQEEDARKLKSYLEQKRRPLISRPKQVPHFAANLGGQLIVPVAGFYLPPDPGIVPPSDPSQINIKSVAQGHGSGWGGGALGFPKFVDVVFSFTPHQSASYSFTACFAFHGFYVLQADDGYLTSKKAEVAVRLWLNAFQFVERGWKSFPAVIDREDDNINEFDNFDHILNFSDTQDFREAEPVVVTARIEVYGGARGSGSHGEVNFEDGDANFIQPQGLWVNPVP
jgi:hypothetical protein